MSDNASLPKGWSVAPLRDLGYWTGGGTPSKANKKFWDGGTVYWVSPKDMKRLHIHSAIDQITEEAITKSSTKLVPENSVLMVTRSGILSHTFPVGINSVPVALNQDMKALTLDKETDPTYTAYYLMSRSQDILQTCSKDGTTVNSIDSDRLGGYPVHLAPPAQQPRIVSKIDELFSQIDEGERALKRVQTLVERYRQSVLKAAVTGELTRDWRAQQKNPPAENGEALLQRILKARRAAWEKAELYKMTAKGKTPANYAWKKKYKEPAAPKTDRLPILPPNWVWASLEQLTTRITSGSRDWKRFYNRGDNVFIMAQNVRPGELDFSHIQYVDPPEDDRDAERSAVHENDLLVTIVGANTGDVCRVPRPLERHYVCQSVALARPALSVVSRFLETYLVAADGGQAQFSEYIYGAGRPHLSFEQLRETCIPIPPLAEQKLT